MRYIRWARDASVGRAIGHSIESVTSALTITSYAGGATSGCSPSGRSAATVCATLLGLPLGWARGVAVPVAICAGMKRVKAPEAGHEPE